MLLSRWKIAAFDNMEQAIIFSKQQHYLYTGKFPFISEPFEVDEEECKLTHPNDDGSRQYIIISNGKTIKAYSQW